MRIAQMRHSNRTSARMMAVLFSLLFVFAVACGDDDGGSGTSNNDNNALRDAGGGDEDGGTEDDGGTEEDGGTEDDGGTEGDGGTEDDGGGGDGCQPLDPAPVDDAQCSLMCQTGCADGQGCVAGTDQQSGNTVFACNPEGQGGQGDTCADASECQAGFLCVGPDENNLECREVCRPNSTDEPQCEGDAICGELQNMEGVGACIASEDNACEPYPNDTCGDQQTCHPSPVGNECGAFDDTASAGDSCAAAAECNNEQACTNFGDGGQCYDLCDPQGDDCADGEQCGGVAFGQGEDAAYYICQGT